MSLVVYRTLRGVAAVLVIVLLAPSLAALLPACPIAAPPEAVDNPGRCAGLWSSRCCDYFAPSSRLAPEIRGSSTPEVHVAVIGATLPASAGGLAVALVASRCEGGGAAPAALLETTFLRL